MTGGDYTIRGRRDWARAIRHTAVVLAFAWAALGIVWGINALSHMPWGDGDGQYFVCNPGQTQVWKQVTRHGNTWNLAVGRSLGNSNNDLVLTCKG